MNKLAVILAAVALSAVAAVLAVPAFLDWKRYEPEISARISALVGRPVQIDGSVGVRLLPTPLFTATEVKVGTDGEVGSAQRVEAALPFWPLLRGDFEPRSLKLVRPLIRVRIDDLDVESLASAVAKGGEMAGGGLDGFIVEGGTVQLTSDGSEVVETLQDVNLAFSRAGARRAYQVTGDLHLRGRPVTLTVDTASPTGAEIPISLQFRLPASDIRGSLYGNVVGEAGRFAGEGRLEGPSLGGLLVQLSGGGEHRSFDVGEEVEQPISIRAVVEATKDSLTLEDVSADVAGVLASGSASLSHSPKGLRADLRLRAGRIDIDRIWGGGGKLDAAPLWRLAEHVGAARISGSLDLAVEAALVGGGVVRDARLALSAEQGDIVVDSLAADLPGAAELLLSGQMLASAPQPTLSMFLEGRAGDLRRTLQWVGYPLPAVPPGRLRSGSITANLTSDGSTASLSGIHAEIDVTTVQGGLTVSLGDRTAFGLSLVADRVDWDSYFPDLTRPEELKSGLVQFVGSDLLGRLPELAGFDANLQLRVTQMSVAGTQIRGVALDALLFEGRLDVRELGYDWALGTKWRLSGRLADLSGDVNGTIGFMAEFEDFPKSLRDFSIPVPHQFDHLDKVVMEGTASGTLADLDLNLDLRGDGFAADFGGRIREAAEGLRYELQGSLRTGDEEPQSPAAMSLAFRAEGGPTATILRELRLDDGGAILTGRADVDWTGPRPVVRATFTTGALDLRRLRPLGHADEESSLLRDLLALASLLEPGGGDVLGTLRGLDARIALVAASLELSAETRLEGVELSAVLAGGVLEVRRLEGRYAGGRFAMTGRLAVPDDPVVSVSIRIDGAETDAIGLALGNLSVAGGTFDLAVALESGVPAARSATEEVRSRGTIELRNGILRIAPPFVRPAAEAQSLTEAVAFQSLKAPFTITEDRLEAPEVVLVTEQGPAWGHVEVDFSRRLVSGEVGFTEGERAGAVLDLSGPLHHSSRIFDGASGP